MALRIGLVNWSRRRAGGVETYLEFLIPRLVSDGHTVALLSEVDHPADRGTITTTGLEEWCVAALGAGRAIPALRHWAPDVLLMNGLADLSLERRVLGIAPAALIAHSYYGTCISGGKTHCFPTVSPCDRVFGPACLAAFYPRRCGGLSPLTMARQYRLQAARLGLLSRYRDVLTLSDHMREEYLKHGCPPDRVHRLPPYVPAPAATLVEARRSHARSEELRLLFAGRLDRLKGCRALVDAVALVAACVKQPVVLDVAGDGPYRSECERRARAIADAGDAQIRFHGWLAAEARDRLLGATDVLVMPSLWPEPYGLAGVEAAAAGVPVAAFQVGAVREWLEPGVNGALAALAEGAGGLAHAIVQAAALGRLAPVAPAAARAAQEAHVSALVGHLARASGAVTAEAVCAS
jgi:glycosyltransferase involved in cell wall biosynthesis